MLFYFVSFWGSDLIASFVCARSCPGRERFHYGFGAAPGRDQPDRFPR
jgi:hypothetical protein